MTDYTARNVLLKDANGNYLIPYTEKADLSLGNLNSAGKAYVAIKGYDSAATYSLNEVVMTVVSGSVKFYRSLADNNTASLSDTTKWDELDFGGGGSGGGTGGEIGDMGFAPLGIDESLNLRRYLNGQVISQSLSPSFTTKVKQAIALFPNLGTTESNWQAEKLLSKFGQVGKFVIDDENQTIRLPAVVNPQGLLSLSGIGNLVNESLPNITGNVSSKNSLSWNINPTVSGAIGKTTKATTCANATGFSGTFATGYDIDASRSSSTYQDNAPVQQEAVQYPYYIQVATGVEETLPAIREYKTNVPYVLGDSKYFEANPYNASWLASNGSYNASSVYPDFWTQLTGVELNSSLNVGDTIEIGGKTYVKRGLPVVLSTGTYTDYDFVVNQNDQTFRLPLLNGEEDLPGTAYEDLTFQASNFTYTAPANGSFSAVAMLGGAYGNFQIRRNGVFISTGYSSGSISVGDTVNLKKGDVVISNFSQESGTPSKITFRFTYAVGNGALYYYVGDTVQDASLINAGVVLGQLSNKADIDASNFNASGKSLLSGLGMPSKKYDNVTVLASGQSYTAPANGYFVYNTAVGGASYVLMNNSTAKIYTADIAGISGTGKITMRCFVPCFAGDSVSLTYSLQSGSSTTLYFVYAKGEN